MLKTAATVALAVTLCIALAPRAPQAADVERVRQTCDRLRQQYGKALEGLATLKALDSYAQQPRPENLVPVMDARTFELFCK
jgi:hypothetical protein